MNKRINISDFALMVQEAAAKYPEAEVLSVGSGVSGCYWYYGLLLAIDGQEIRFKIPAHKEGGE